MRCEMAGGPCEFLRDGEESPQFRPIAFSSKRTKGYEKRLHSHLGKGFAGDWGPLTVWHYGGGYPHATYKAASENGKAGH